jgi:hypothetical protein
MSAACQARNHNRSVDHRSQTNSPELPGVAKGHTDTQNPHIAVAVVLSLEQDISRMPYAPRCQIRHMISLAGCELRCLVSHFPLALDLLVVTGSFKTAASAESPLSSTFEALALLEPPMFELKNMARRIGNAS